MAIANGKRIMLTGDTGITLRLAATIVGLALACAGAIYAPWRAVTTRLERIETNQIINANAGWDKVDDEAHMHSVVVKNGLASVPHTKAVH